MTPRTLTTGVATVVALTLLGACAPAATQVQGVKFTAAATGAPTTTPVATASATVQPGPDGALAVRLVPPTTAVAVGEEVTLDLQYATSHGGLVGTVEDFGDGGVGGLKISDCHVSETNPSSGSKELRHVWTAPGSYVVTVTVSTLSCVHGQEDVTATAEVVVR